MTDRMAGSSACEASSSVFFSEGVPSGMSVAVDAREITRCSLACRDIQKGIEK